MDQIIRKAYAKINIGLDVLRRRADGYHEVRMIMQTVDLCDDPVERRSGEYDGVNYYRRTMVGTLCPEGEFVAAVVNFIFVITFLVHVIRVGNVGARSKNPLIALAVNSRLFEGYEAGKACIARRLDGACKGLSGARSAVIDSVAIRVVTDETPLVAIGKH